MSRQSAATTSPLLDQSIDGAHNVLFNITHGGSLKLQELDQASRIIAEVVDPSANIIFGTVVDPAVGDDVHITVIATGFDGRFRRERRERPEERRPPGERGPREREREPEGEGFDVPAEVLEVPSFLRED